MKYSPIAAIALLTGCSIAPPRLEETSHTQYKLPYAKIIVEDFTQDRPVRAGDVVWVNGWVPILDGTRGPSPNKTLVRYLGSALVADGGKDSLRISLIDSGYYMEKNLADDMAFVNLVAGARERGYKCTASVSLGTADKVERKEFEAGERRSGFFDMEWGQSFLTRCREQLVNEIQAYLKSWN
jgi:hypothetical protein